MILLGNSGEREQLERLRYPNMGKDLYEFKLLLGDELFHNWHWGSNLVYEKEMGGQQSIEYQFYQGLSVYTDR